MDFAALARAFKPLVVVAVTLMLAASVSRASQEPGPRDEGPEDPPATIEAEGLRLRYVPLPWPPEGDGAWPVGRIETNVPLRLDGRTLEPGHYALVCEGLHHGGSATFDVVRLGASEWLDPDEARRRPQGETLFRAPVRFDLATGATPRLTITLMPDKRGITLEARYGNGRFVSVFER